MTSSSSISEQNKQSDPKGRHLLMPLAFGNFAIGIGAFIVIGILSPMADSLGLTKADAGWVMTFYALSYALTSPVLVALTGGFDRRNLMIVALGIFFVATLASAFATTPEPVFIARVLAAFGAGMYTPNAAAVAASSVAPERRAMALATVFSGIAIAQVLGVPAGSYLGYTLGWQSAFWAVAVLLVIAMIWLLRVVPRGIAFQPTSLAVLGRTLLTPVPMVAVTITATMISSYYVMFTFIAPIVEWRLGMGRDGVTIILFVLGVGAVLGNWLGGYLTNKIGPERTIMVIALTQLIFLPAATLYPFGLVDGAILFFIWSTITWGFIVPQQTRLIKAMPHAQNVILALNAACIYIGAAVGSAIGGTFYRIFGIEWLGPVGAVVAFLGALHLALSMRQFRIAERVTA